MRLQCLRRLRPSGGVADVVDPVAKFAAEECQQIRDKVIAIDSPAGANRMHFVLPRGEEPSVTQPMTSSDCGQVRFAHK
jgi:hypothetical protein